jgi:hypothetical protein
MTSRNDVTVLLRKDRVAKSQTLTHQGLRLHPKATSRKTLNEALTGGFTTFHFPPPTGVGATPTRRPLPMMSGDSRTAEHIAPSPVAAGGGDR